MPLAFVFVIAAGGITPALVWASSPNSATTPVLAQGGFSLQSPPADIGGVAPIRVAQSKDTAQLTVRIQELEDTVRTLTGQVEGLQFQLTQMQELIQKMQDDNEFRFQQLEGGAGKKTSAATQSGGVTPSGVLPQAPASAEPQNLEVPAPLAAAEANTDLTTTTPADNLGDSADPLLGKGGTNGQAVSLGTLSGGELPDLGAGRPLDLSLDGGQQVSNGDANAQYQAGYEAIVRGDYGFAEDQFRQFIALYPKDAQAADATNWLGEALLQRGAYADAADVLTTGYQNYPKSPRAPDILLKLGVALAGAGESDMACRTLFEVSKRYPTQSPAFVKRLGEEKARANCPV